jgi:hypothetical protein
MATVPSTAKVFPVLILLRVAAAGFGDREGVANDVMDYSQDSAASNCLGLMNGIDRQQDEKQPFPPPLFATALKGNSDVLFLLHPQAATNRMGPAVNNHDPVCSLAELEPEQRCLSKLDMQFTCQFDGEVEVPGVIPGWQFMQDDWRSHPFQKLPSCNATTGCCETKSLIVTCSIPVAFQGKLNRSATVKVTLAKVVVAEEGKKDGQPKLQPYATQTVCGSPVLPSATPKFNLTAMVLFGHDLFSNLADAASFRLTLVLEWIFYHILQGVEHVYVYDITVGIRPPFTPPAPLQKLSSLGLVTVIPWPVANTVHTV